MSPTVVEQLCTGGIWVWGRPLLIGRGGGVGCNETGELNEHDRLSLCVWSGFGDYNFCLLFKWL